MQADSENGGEPAILHIVNGDSFGDRLRASGMDGDILVWRESLYEGPLSVSFTDVDTRRARLRYFANRGVPAQHFQRVTQAQEAALEQSGLYDKIILWFEHDLYDQAMLIYLLQWFGLHEQNKARLYILCIDSFPGVDAFRGLGQLTPEQVRTLAGMWQPITNEQLILARKTWSAYASSDPSGIAKLLIEEDTTALPFLKRSMLFHLKRFPSIRNGLGQIEQHTLRAAEAGITQIDRLFRYVSEAAADYGLGDSQYWTYLDDLRTASSPLLDIDGPALPSYNPQGPLDFNNWRVRLTEFGKNVLYGAADHVLFNGIDRWLGGCHLQGRDAIWRWDKASDRLVKK